MAVKAFAESAADGDDHEGYDGSGQNGVRGQNSEVNGPRPALSRKVHRTNVRVVVEVGNQEKS